MSDETKTPSGAPTAWALSLRSKLSKSGYTPLKSAESALFQSISEGQDPSLSLAQGVNSGQDALSYKWDTGQQIRGGFISWLFLQLAASKDNLAPTFSIQGANFTEKPVNLSRIDLPIAVSFDRCKFDQHIDVSGSHFSWLAIEESWVAWVKADGIRIDGDLSLDGLVTQYRVDLENARIGQKLRGVTATFGEQSTKENPDCDPGTNFYCNCVLNLQGIDVAKGIDFTNSTTWGMTALIGAVVGGDLDLSGGNLNGRGNYSLLLEKVTVGGDIFLADGFQSTGPVQLTSIAVKNGLRADGGTFRWGPNGKKQGQSALKIWGSQISGDSTFSGSFTAEGLSLENSTLGPVTVLGSVGSGILNLQNSSVSRFVDSNQTRPTAGQLQVDGFTYTSIHENNKPNEIDWLDRLKWLQLDHGKSPQPFRQLAKVLKEQGDDDGATRVLEAMDKKMIADGSGTGRIGGSLSATIGYGYEPLNSVGWLLALTALGAIIYRRSYLAGNITPTDKDAYEHFKTAKKTLPYYPKFSALFYSLENSLPLVNLGQASKWQPDPMLISAGSEEKGHTLTTDENEKAWRKFQKRVRDGLIHSKQTSKTGWLQAFLWAQILLGWLLATLFVGGITGLIQR